ncbi:GDSL-type esterase/lipase family protein [Enterococcus sp. AZ196]|uniref:GDSL-type esterase/lipase family protein n=1 Tax=Enterococcus sp. AZ196 TaxID=2774659 RepID=UPI003D27410D
MGWTTVWSHAQRGIAHHCASKGTVQLTLRQIVPAKKIRLVFKNEYGTQKQKIQNLSFKTNEKREMIPDFSIDPGEIVKTASILIDPKAEKWQICFHVSTSESGFSYEDADIFTGAREMDFCSGLMAIEAEITGQCVVAFGDSLTEGATWTAPLQRSLRKQNIYLVNQGINGSCLLKSNSDISTKDSQNFFYGYSGVQRLKNCLNSHCNVEKVILFIGINDLINGELTLESFQVEIEKMIQLCERYNVAYQLCTLTPCLGYLEMNEAKEVLRKEINTWLIRNFDDLWDFSTIVEGTQGCLKRTFDSGDHLHFNAIAGLAIARQISSDFVKGE